ncbi:MAG: hypothetical protein H7Y18_06170 [Clostridiaceae bacterium]|nr:hypothetical protein [Clostridiaceae bacterium]
MNSIYLRMLIQRSLQTYNPSLAITAAPRTDCHKLIIVFTFSYIEFQTIRAALTGEHALGVLFLPIVLVSLFGTLGFYIKKSIKSK